MGSGPSKPHCVIGKPTAPEPRDPIEVEFEKLVNSHSPTDSERAYTENFRRSTTEKYEPSIDIGVTDVDMLRHKIINILREYSRMIDNIDTKIDNDCGTIKGFCPRHVFDPESGEEREVQPLDRLYPCQLRTCMKQQLRRQSAKFKRWIVNMKWAGDTAKSEFEVENIPIDRRGLLEILESLQKLSLRMIEDASSVYDKPEDNNMTTGVCVEINDSATPNDTNKSFRDNTLYKNTVNFIINYKNILISIIVIILIIVIFSLMFQFVSPSHISNPGDVSLTLG